MARENKGFDVVALGELLVDFTENGASGQGNALFEACPGGAPCNVLAILHNRYPNIRVLNVTAGAEGSYSFYGDEEPIFVPAFRLGGTIETTGAGDTFCASVLNYVLEHGIDGLTAADRREMLRFANAAAYLVTTKKGAIRSMPECSAVEHLLAANP